MTQFELDSPMSDEELFVFSEKLATWGEQLTPKERVCLLGILTNALPSTPSEVQGYLSDVFLKLGDIKGESIDDKHQGEIELLAVRWGVTPPKSGKTRR
jgi:hypothetical protein